MPGAGIVIQKLTEDTHTLGIWGLKEFHGINVEELISSNYKWNKRAVLAAIILVNKETGI